MAEPKYTPPAHTKTSRRERSSRPTNTRSEKRSIPRKNMAVQLPPEDGMERFRIELGNNQGVKPGNIVGAIANEADISSKYIGRISIFDSYSTVDLPFGMPEDILRVLQRARIGSKQMRLQKLAEKAVGNTSPQQAPQPKTKRRAQGMKNKAPQTNPSAASSL